MKLIGALQDNAVALRDNAVHAQALQKMPSSPNFVFRMFTYKIGLFHSSSSVAMLNINSNCALDAKLLVYCDDREFWGDNGYENRTILNNNNMCLD